MQSHKDLQVLSRVCVSVCVQVFMCVCLGLWVTVGICAVVHIVYWDRYVYLCLHVGVPRRPWQE